jgi:Fibronectin type III domain
LGGFGRSCCVAAAAALFMIGAGAPLVAPTTAFASSPSSLPTKWSALPSANLGSQDNILTSVSCTAPSKCAAVGFSETGVSTYDTLIETSNGGAWSVVPSDSPGTTRNFLNGVSCASSTSCVAVGTSLSGTVSRALIETFDGTRWTTASNPNPGPQYDVLNGVTCTSATNCVAVGSYNPPGIQEQTLIETFDGTNWSVATSASQPTGNNTLNGVSCPTAAHCTAVGTYRDGDSSATLIESLAGGIWSIVSSPNQGTTGSVLSAVSCATARSCVSVGNYLDDADIFNHSLVETWNGSSWSITPIPGTGTDGEFLAGVSCATTTHCVAVGWSNNNPPATLVESWDGVAWTVTSSPNPQANYDLLNAVSCESAQTCVAVGYDGAATRSEALILSGSEADPPNAPARVIATARSQSASVSWTKPKSNGGAISSYAVTASPGDISVTVPATQTTARVKGLTNGVAYMFTVQATNIAGPSLPSAPSSPITPGR